MIDTGIDRRTIVSGIAEHYTPEELVGRQVLVLVNLEPRELRGVLSQGMILMAQDSSGKLVLLAVVAPGAILTAGISGPDVSSSLQPVAQKSRAATNRLAK